MPDSCFPATLPPFDAALDIRLAAKLTLLVSDMPIPVEIPPPLREHVGGLLTVPATGTTVAAVLADLAKQYPAIEAKLFVNGKLRPHVNVLVNEEDIRFLDELDTATPDGSVVSLMPAVSGG